MMDTDIFDDEIFGFHARQSAEKCFRAWMAFLGIECPHIHDISVLLASLKRAGADVEEYWDLVEYNAFAVQFRYQPIGDSDEPIDREAAIRKAEQIVEHIRTLIESGDRR